MSKGADFIRQMADNLPEVKISKLEARVAILEVRADKHKANFARVNELLKQCIARIEEQDRIIAKLKEPIIPPPVPQPECRHANSTLSSEPAKYDPREDWIKDWIKD